MNAAIIALGAAEARHGAVPAGGLTQAQVAKAFQGTDRATRPDTSV